MKKKLPTNIDQITKSIVNDSVVATAQAKSIASEIESVMIFNIIIDSVVNVAVTASSVVIAQPKSIAADIESNGITFNIIMNSE